MIFPDNMMHIHNQDYFWPLNLVNIQDDPNSTFLISGNAKNNEKIALQ